MLLLLRSTWPGIPIAVVGNSMVRRSLSLVASNTMGPLPEVNLLAGEPLMALTHEIIWAGEAANAADLTQQFLRASTTYLEFYKKRGFVSENGESGVIKVLAQGHAWVTVLSCVIFNAWFSSRFEAAAAGDGGEGAAPAANAQSRCGSKTGKETASHQGCILPLLASPLLLLPACKTS